MLWGARIYLWLKRNPPPGQKSPKFPSLIYFFVVENRKRKFQAVDNVGQENQRSTSTNVSHKILEESYTFALKNS